MVTHAYVENEVYCQDGVELVCLLYAKALEKIGDASRHLNRGLVKERATAIGDAMAIVVELQSSLDFERGGEISRNLADLYAYVQQRLIAANAEQSVEALEECRKLLSTLYEGWHEAREASSSAGPASEMADEPASTRCSWTL